MAHCPRNQSPLHYALKGSQRATLEELSEAFRLLIKAGGDIHSEDCNGHPASFYAHSIDQLYSYRDREGVARVATNHDLSLEKIWLDALAACEEDVKTKMDIEERSATHEDSKEEPLASAEARGFSCSPRAQMLEWTILEEGVDVWGS